MFAWCANDNETNRNVVVALDISCSLCSIYVISHQFYPHLSHKNVWAKNKDSLWFISPRGSLIVNEYDLTLVFVMRSIAGAIMLSRCAWEFLITYKSKILGPDNLQWLLLYSFKKKCVRHFPENIERGIFVTIVAFCGFPDKNKLSLALERRFLESG